MTRRTTRSGKASKARRRNPKSRQTGRRNRSSAGLQKQLLERTRELAESQRQLAEALEQQAATSEVLKVISSSPGALESVFKSMLENATRLCAATFGNIYLTEAGAWKLAAAFGSTPARAMARASHSQFRPCSNR